jgi:hypothetical protein
MSSPFFYKYIRLVAAFLMEYRMNAFSRANTKESKEVPKSHLFS